MRKLIIIFSVFVSIAISCRQGIQNQGTEIQSSIVANNQIEKEKNTRIDEKASDSIYIHVEKMPKFPGGDSEMMSYFAKNIKIPSSIPKSEYLELTKRGIFRFVVLQTGKISGVEVIRSIHPVFDKEIVRVIESMPEWIPAEHLERKVNVQMTLPFHWDIRID